MSESTKLGEVGNSDWGAKKGTSGSTQIGYIVTVDGRPLPSPVFHYATMNATVKASASKYNGRSGNRLGTTIHLQASAHDPFIPIAPNLDFSVDFNFNYDCSKPGKVFVSVNGTHDAFPDYEALITTAPSSLNAPIFGTNIYYARATGSLLLGLLWGYTFASREYVINAPTPAY